MPAQSSAHVEPLASSRLDYIDGLRAIAITSIVGFHAGLPGFGGGFVGVDIFFVISGFLITHQIVDQASKGHFSFAGFYSRRILRILPPFLLVVVATLVLAKLFPLLPKEIRGLTMSAAASAGMVSNYYFANTTDYFSDRLEINPLLHTWSLAVEEQYYLLAPVVTVGIVALATRRHWNKGRALLSFGVATVLASALALAILGTSDRHVSFFSILTRAWQFGCGGLLAILVLQGFAPSLRLRLVLGFCGVVAIAFAVVTFDKLMLYPQLLTAAVPTLGTAFLLASGLGASNGLIVRLLCTRPVVAIGLVSYSWYLWHWPMVQLAQTLPTGRDTMWQGVAASLLALAVSVPTYLFLERPLRTFRQRETAKRFSREIVAGGLVVSSLVAAISFGLAHRTPVNNLETSFSASPTRPLTGCLSRDVLPSIRRALSCAVGQSETAPTILIWGDSHAAQLAPIAGWWVDQAASSTAVVSIPACPPLLGMETKYFGKTACKESNDAVLAWLRAPASSVTGVVLAARWPFYDGSETPAGEAILPRMTRAEAGRSDEKFAELLNAGLSDLIGALPNRRILLVGPAPELKHSPGNCIARAELNGQSRDTCAPDTASVEARRSSTMRTLRLVVAKFPTVRLIDPAEAFCTTQKCWPFGPDGTYYSDTDHLNPRGAEILYQHFEADFRWVAGMPAKS